MVINTQDDLRDYVVTLKNELGFKLIKVWQKDRNFQDVQGIKAVKYRKLPKGDDGFMDSSDNHDYHPRVTSGSLRFFRDPFPGDGMPQGTGKVMYLLDDDTKLPDVCLSGAIKGWNKEFLASNYYEGLFIIDDKRLDKEIKKRADAIMQQVPDPLQDGKVLEEPNQPKQVTMTEEQLELMIQERTAAELAKKLQSGKQIINEDQAPEPEDNVENVESDDVKSTIAG